MDIKIFALVAFVTVLGSFTEARSPFGYPYGTNGLRDWPNEVSRRSRREIDNSNGESTTSQATTTSSSTTDSTSTDPSSSTTSSSTTPSSSSTTPSTESTTTEATSSTTPTSTSDTTPSSSSTTPASSTTESTEPTSEKPNDVPSRLNTDDKPEDSTKKPESDKMSTPSPYPPFGAPGFGFPTYPYFDPYFAYPGFNSIPSYGPNYGWTGTNSGPGYASAGASAGSFAYPGLGYPMAFPTAVSPTGLPTGSPSYDSRGGFQDNSPNQNNSPNKDSSPNQNGYNFGGDPLYNAGPGFFYPGQFPNFNDPTFDMIKQIQAQIEAQHKANMELHNRLLNEAANYGNYGGGEPQIASASIGLGPYGGFQSGQISPAAPGIESRFADDLPAPSGNSYGVFASSSSSSITGPDGKPINRKSSITGVNDNGKISFRTVHD